MQIILTIIFVIAVGIGGYLYSVYQKCLKLLKDIDEQFMTTDVYFKQRLKLLPGLVELVRGYAEHEKATYDEVESILALKYTSMNREQKEATNNRLSEAIAKLIAIVDNYPNLKSSVGFIKKEEELSSVEKEIIYGIRDYNKYIDEFNKLISSFPGDLIAQQCKFAKLKRYENKYERANLKLSF